MSLRLPNLPLRLIDHSVDPQTVSDGRGPSVAALGGELEPHRVKSLGPMGEMVFHVEVGDGAAVIVQKSIGQCGGFDRDAGEHWKPRCRVVAAAGPEFRHKVRSPGLLPVFPAVEMHVSPGFAYLPLLAWHQLFDGFL